MGVRRHMADRNNRLDEQPIERVVRCVDQVQGAEIDLLVPGREKLVIDLELSREVGPDRHAGPACPALQPLPEFAAVHRRPTSAVRRPRYDPRTATAAGVTPGIREAWPSVSG